MLKFNQIRSFYSVEKRDEYCSEPDLKEVVYINAEHIVSIEKVEFTNYPDKYTSSYEITCIVTTKGHWNVEGNANEIAYRVADALR